MEKISANSDTRFRVKPHAHEANSVTARVTTTATPTMKTARWRSVTSRQAICTAGPPS